MELKLERRKAWLEMLASVSPEEAARIKKEMKEDEAREEAFWQLQKEMDEDPNL